LTPDDLSALADYTGPGYQDLNSALRSGALDASQPARIDALNKALEKLPAYDGPVVRGTNLPPEVLEQYQPGEVITESAFTSTTTDPAVAQSPAFAGNVEFRILSSTGRDVSSLSMLPDEQEVLFPTNTKFYVISRTVDPVTGRTIIEMIER
jgi:ADP-ribosyltransferase exoenzyme